MLTIISITAFILGIFYLIGFWNARIAGKVEIILLAIANLEPKHHRILRIPDRIALPIKKFALDLVHKRRMRAARKEAKTEFKRLREKSYKKTVPK